MIFFVLLIAWILGISTMGHMWPDRLISSAPIFYAISLLLLIIGFFKLPLTMKLYFQALKMGFIALSVFLIGHNFAVESLQERLQHRINAVEERTEIVYISRLSELNRKDSRESIQQIAQLAHNENQKSHGILLYLNDRFSQSDLKLGHYYQITGTVKPAHSYAIPHVFDQEKWLIQQNIMGTMQVNHITPISKGDPRLAPYKGFVQSNSNWIIDFKISTEQLRLDYRNFIQSQSLTNKGLLLALLTGDESLLSDVVKEQFRVLGISHLLAISGPHVLIFAVIICFFINQIISKFKPQIFLNIPRPYLLVIPFLSCVLLYTAFVGFEIPAMRTLLTVTIISVVILLKQQVNALKLLFMSASILLLIDPFSILSPAFWLSYGACFILIRVYQTMMKHRNWVDGIKVESWQVKIWTFFRVLVDSQWKVFIALFPLVAIIFQQISWISPLINLIAIPLIGIVIVPLEVVGALLSTVSEPLGLLLFHCADWVLSFLLSILALLQRIFEPQLTWLSLSSLSIVSVGIGIIILFLPKLVIPKAWALICFLPLVIPLKREHEFALTVLDIGQGQAIHVQSQDQQLMIDVGGYYDESKFSVGRQLMIPYLMGEGISTLDQVYLSHLDQDHAGAFNQIAQTLKINQIRSNQQDERFQGFNFDYCYAGQTQHIGNIRLSVLAPQRENLTDVDENKNELSCVIYIEVLNATGMKNFLIMGDAGWQTEYELLQQYPNLQVDVLILGHHGSQHSSSYDFLKRIKPKVAIASAGFNNRYHHPHPIVLARLEALSIPYKTTIDHGSLQFTLKNGEINIESYRDSKLWLRRE